MTPGYPFALIPQGHVSHTSPSTHLDILTYFTWLSFLSQDEQLTEELRISRSDSQRLKLRGVMDIAKFSLSLAIENCFWLRALCLL